MVGTRWKAFPNPSLCQNLTHCTRRSASCKPPVKLRLISSELRQSGAATRSISMDCTSPSASVTSSTVPMYPGARTSIR